MVENRLNGLKVIEKPLSSAVQSELGYCSSWSICVHWLTFAVFINLCLWLGLTDR